MLPYSFDYCVILDGQSRIISVNSAVSHLFGLPAHELVGTPWGHWLDSSAPDTAWTGRKSMRLSGQTHEQPLAVVEWHSLQTTEPVGQILLGRQCNPALLRTCHNAGLDQSRLSRLHAVSQSAANSPDDVAQVIENCFTALMGAKDGIMILCHALGEPYPANTRHQNLPSRSNMDKITKVIAMCEVDWTKPDSDLNFSCQGSSAVIPLWIDHGSWAAVYLSDIASLPPQPCVLWLSNAIMLLRQIARTLWDNACCRGQGERDQSDIKKSSRISSSSAAEITQQRETPLGISRDELERLLESLSHDLKTPIVSLTGWVTILHDNFEEKLGPQGGQIVQRILRNLRKIDRVVGDIVSYTRVAVTRERPQYFSVKNLVDRVLGNFLGLINERGITMFPPVADVEMSGERGRIQLMFSLLIDNAIRHMNRAEGAEIEICVEDEDENVRLVVADNGVGIASQYHEKVFNIFQRISTLDQEGTGMGLALVKKIVDLHGGNISLISAEGHGAKFIIQLPKRPWLWDLPWDRYSTDKSAL